MIPLNARVTSLARKNEPKKVSRVRKTISRDESSEQDKLRRKLYIFRVYERKSRDGKSLSDELPSASSPSTGMSERSNRRGTSARRARESRSHPKGSSSRDQDRDSYDEDKYDRNSTIYEGGTKEAEVLIERSEYSNWRTPPPRSSGYESPDPEPSVRSPRATHTNSSDRNNSHGLHKFPYQPHEMSTPPDLPGLKTSLRPSLFSGSRSATATHSIRSKTSSSGDILNTMVMEVVPPRSKVPNSKPYNNGFLNEIEPSIFRFPDEVEPSVFRSGKERDTYNARYRRY